MTASTVQRMTVEEPAPVERRRIPTWLKIAAPSLVVLLGGMIAVLVIVLGRQSPGEQARDACMEAVRDQLKAPSTALFSDVSDVSSGDLAAAAGKSPKPGADSFFAISGKVEAQNALGVPIRSSFICTAERKGDSWSATATVF
jgi:hypothetical protein